MLLHPGCHYRYIKLAATQTCAYCLQYLRPTTCTKWADVLLCMHEHPSHVRGKKLRGIL